jgi:hypothetical protein
MAIDLNDAGPQGDRNLLPPGPYQLKMQINYGGAGPDGALRRAKNGRTLMLELECTVTQGEHRGRKLWDYILLELDENAQPALEGDKLDKLRTAVPMGRSKLRAIVDSARGLDPTDSSEAARTKRHFESYADLDELVFWAQLDERPGSNGYGPRNIIDFIIVPGDSAYPATPAQGAGSAVVPRKSFKDDFDDDIPY